MLYNLKIIQNSLLFLKTSKIYKINYKILNQQFFFHLIKTICSTTRTAQKFFNYRQTYLKIFKDILKHLLFKQKQLTFNVGNIKNQKILKKQNFFNSKFLTLSPKIFT